MVDISNNPYRLESNLNYSFTASFCEQVPLLDLDETDLFNLSACDEYNYNLLPDTPPETPVNNVNGNGNVSSGGQSYSDSFSLSSTDIQDTSLLHESSYCPTLSQLSLSGLPVCSSSLPQVPIDNANLLITTPSLSLPPPLQPSVNTFASNSLSPSLAQSVVNQPNGIQLNGNHLVYANNRDNHSSNSIINKSNSQLKSILPSVRKSSPNTPSVAKLTEQQQLLLKKQKVIEARKLRNREAALNSRLKKQDYVQKLESTVKQLTKERDELAEENKLLVKKVKELECQLTALGGHCFDLNGNYEAGKKKAKFSLFAVVFMVCIQLSPYLISMAPTAPNTAGDQLGNFDTTGSVTTQPVQHVGRSLLWKRDTDSTESEFYPMSKKISKHFNSTTKPAVTVYSNQSIHCSDYYNQTESLRLESELRDWLTRFQLEELQVSASSNRRKIASAAAANSVPRSPLKLQHSKRQNGNKKLLFDSKYVPIPRLKMWMQKQKYSDYLPDELNNHGGSHHDEVHNNQTGPYPFDLNSLLASVHRRDDTFYYLSYPSKGHLVLPPISNRTDIRPRFSFLIPSYNLSLEDSSSSSHKTVDTGQQHKLNGTHSAISSPQMFLLQIDCQVINTKVTLLNVYETNSQPSPSNNLPLRPPIHNSATKPVQ